MRLSILAIAITLGLVAPFASGQTSIVSPRSASTVEGASENSWPWASSIPRVYQQIHSDLGANVLTIKGMSWRVEEAQSRGQWRGVRSIDVEVAVGLAPSYERISRRFADNFSTGTRKVVMKRRVVRFGPQGMRARGPRPFLGMDIVFDAPFVYPGIARGSLVWEAKVFSSVLRNDYFSSLDADQGSVFFGTVQPVGRACVARGRQQAMYLVPFVADVQGTLALGGEIGFAPANRPALVIVGARDPSLVIPGLCTRLHATLDMAFVLGLTNARGELYSWERFMLHMPNRFVGVRLAMQAFVLDPGRANTVPFAASDGQIVVVPSVTRTKRVQVSRMFNNAGGVTAQTGLRFGAVTVGYGLVTRFNL